MTVSMQSRLNHRCIREGEPATLYLLVQIGATATKGGARPPLNIGAVVDRSGSMAGAKLAYTKSAIRFLVDHPAGPEGEGAAGAGDSALSAGARRRLQ